MPAEEPLLTSRDIWTRFSICDRTFDRWVASPALNFPRPIVIRRRRYWYLRDVERWERSARANKTRPGHLPPKAA